MLCANKFSLILQTDKCSLLLSIQIQDNYSDLPAVTDRSVGRQIMRMKFSTAKATICPGFAGHISQSQLSLGWKNTLAICPELVCVWTSSQAGWHLDQSHETWSVPLHSGFRYSGITMFVLPICWGTTWDALKIQKERKAQPWCWQLS